MANNVIGKFCSVAKKGTIILPKDIPGYISPEGQVLEEDGQKFNFVYTPIDYNINYNLDGGILEDPKTTYTVEEEYTPSTPCKEGYTFIKWEPSKIEKGNIGDVTFNAKYLPNAILLSGKKLNKAIAKFVGKENLIAIQYSVSAPDSNFINVSSTDTPIYATFNSGILYLYSDMHINCNDDMSGAFKGFTILNDINILSDWTTKENMNIASIFEGCAMLSDVSAINNWANGKFSDFTSAFKGTAACSAGRVPSWYKWEVTLNYKSSRGTIIDSITEYRIPNEEIYPKAINGYTAITEKIEIIYPDTEYVFEYSLIEYPITYMLHGGELVNPKTTYTIEDEDYYPPTPVKDGYTFVSWDPECIFKGDYGSVTFIANYIKE